ncbi:pyridoxamine 5'-phosphate oxidase family protein [Caulobacter sp. 17J80-11]|uniref:pyridoxamine 5'-phosphate oxidase family protein n=1 Tax=Caulobacter sp. 17J80-11 TaxID=2763502 RepID=UPI0016538C79|nr:pyridoxamine 5'-phosphate oxidase family protein [Caulobacter sp. 17J80-11]MBC6981402.1 pyridoxamine 5'-phosphate oxidase family protein [Caulobacter sp. 17J80-11]
MDTERLLTVARALVDNVAFCVAGTQAEAGGANVRVVQPMRVQDDWTVNVITNRRCRKVREIERFKRLTLLYQSDDRRSYVCLAGPAEVVEDIELKRATWTPAHDRWNPGGPENPATVFMRLKTDRIELWSASQGIMPEPEGYSAAVLLRHPGGWKYETT